MSKLCKGCDEIIHNPESDFCEQCEELALLNLLDPLEDEYTVFRQDVPMSELDEYDEWLDELEANRELTDAENEFQQDKE